MTCFAAKRCKLVSAGTGEGEFRMAGMCFCFQVRSLSGAGVGDCALLNCCWNSVKIGALNFGILLAFVLILSISVAHRVVSESVVTLLNA